MPQYCGLVRTLHQTLYTVTSVSVTGLRSSRTRANKLVSIVSRFFWLVLSNLISLSRSWESKSKKHLSLHSSLDCSRERWVSHRSRSLRSNRFIGTKKRTRNDEELGFRFWPVEKWDESQKMKQGEGKFPFFLPHLSPLFYSSHFLRRLVTLVPCSLLRNGTETLARQTIRAGIGGD